MIDILNGPWRATKSGASVRPVDGSGTVLAFVNDYGDERLKIATLMAAAPELRDALKALRDWCYDHLSIYPDELKALNEQADVVLKKVQG